MATDLAVYGPGVGPESLVSGVIDEIVGTFEVPQFTWP